MILTPAQAQAIYSAMCALNNIGATASDIDADEFDIRIRCGVIAIRGSSNDFAIPIEREDFINQAAFAAAYNLN